MSLSEHLREKFPQRKCLAADKSDTKHELLTRLFPEKGPTAADLHEEIEELQRLANGARELIAVNDSERDRLGALLSIEEFAEVERSNQMLRLKIQSCEAKLAILEPVHADFAAAEANQNFEHDKANLANRSASLWRLVCRLQADLPEHAQAITGMLREVQALERLRADLKERACELGRKDWQVENSEQFRNLFPAGELR